MTWGIFSFFLKKVTFDPPTPPKNPLHMSRFLENLKKNRNFAKSRLRISEAIYQKAKA